MPWSALLTAFLSALGKFLADLINRTAADDAHEAKARAEGEAKLHQTIAEAADEQAQINAADRGDAAAVLERLQRRINPPGGA